MQFPIKQETLNERNQALLVTVVLVLIAVALHHERDFWFVSHYIMLSSLSVLTLLLMQARGPKPRDDELAVEFDGK